MKKIDVLWEIYGSAMALIDNSSNDDINLKAYWIIAETAKEMIDEINR